MLLVIVFSLFIQNPAIAGINFVTVDVTGSASSVKDAVVDGLTQALMQVNGGQISSSTEMALSSLSQSINDEEFNANSEEFHKKITSSTQGTIKNYQIVRQYQNPALNNDWAVEMKVTVAKYKQSAQVKRLRLAVLPIKIVESNGQAKKFTKSYTSDLTSYLTQTRKFAMIDREYLDQQSNELEAIVSGGSPVEEFAKLGQKLGTDYIVTGSLLEAFTNERIVVMQSTGTEISMYDHGVSLSYRIIDIATGQIKFADEYKSFGTQQNGRRSLNSLSANAVKAIGQKILNAIYPIRVEAVSDGLLVLGQGGDTVKIGQEMRLVQLGDKIVDSYTGESLGRSEIEVGIIEIVDVQAKQSKAKIVKTDTDILTAFKQGQFIARPTGKISKASVNKKSEEPTTSTDSAIEELKKVSDDDW